MTARCALVSMALGLSLLSACSSGGGHDAAAADPSETSVAPGQPATVAPETTTTLAPTTTTVSTTVPPSTAAPTTTVDEATKRFYEQFGGPRAPVTPLKDPHPTQTQGQCTVVPGGFGVKGEVPWSDGFTETVSSPGPFTASATHVATGSRGSWADITITGPTCLASVSTVS